jgi:HSP20 family protein
MIIMTLTRWHRPEVRELSPFRRMSTLRDEVDQLFDRVFDRFLESPLDIARGPQFLAGWLPAVDLYEDKDSLIVRAELPGMKKEDIDIALHNGFLTLSGERKEQKKYEEGETFRSERFLGRFQRTIGLPSKVDAEKIKATYKDGVLTVVLPKSEEAKPKQIPVDVK